ncbi:crossover junction endodeoxyribonuclease RuvC [Candidatus Gracilibacteria bacterium]|nr:crossover junction endodeoxyribonuclease RuvC [Candidatus Gracilibacteria bacterium]
MIIIGIDPGTTTIGYAVIKKEKNKIEILDYGVISTTPKASLKDKLSEIGDDLKKLFLKYKPDIGVVEKLFFTNNLKTGIDVAQVRGVIIYLLSINDIFICEYTPLELKKGICGNGKASKKQMQNAIKILFGLDEIPKPDDASDAMGLAYLGNNKKSF